MGMCMHLVDVICFMSRTPAAQKPGEQSMAFSFLMGFKDTREDSQDGGCVPVQHIHPSKAVTDPGKNATATVIPCK